MARRRDWVDLFRAVGHEYIAVLRSECAVLVEAWQQGTLRLALKAAIFLAVAVFFSLILVLLVTAATVLTVERFTRLELWQATWVVAAAVLVVIAILGAIGQLVYARHIKNPKVTAEEHFRDHQNWLRERLFEDQSALPEGGDHGASEDEAHGSGRARESTPAD